MAKNDTKKKKFFDISDPVYGGAVSVFVNWSIKEINAYLKKKGFDYVVEFAPDNSAGFFFFYDNNHKYSFMTIRGFDWTIGKQADAVHELLHFIFEELNSRGLPLTRESQEAYTYLFQYYFQELWKNLISYKM